MSTSRGPIRHEMLSWADVDKIVDILLPQLRSIGSIDALLMITRGGLVPGGLLSEALEIAYVLTAAVNFPVNANSDTDRAMLAALPSFLQFPEDDLIKGRRVLIVDDVWGSGRTSTAVKNRCEGAGAYPFTCVFHFNPYRSLFTRQEPNFYGAVTDAHIVYPWEVDRGTFKMPFGMPEAN
ncbi:MAG: phosphoribosyltransferase [Anaerolineae bacterium]|nr:phosphoribosyltransferase [Anaerolineae bacterium]